MKRYLTAGEATAALGVNRATLYAYVSRGLIRSEPTGEGNKAHRYRADDVQKLAARKAQRQNPAKAAEDALHWGGPVLESALTFISEQGLYYRGQNALTLAREATFEAVAALLWTGDAARADLFQGGEAPDVDVPRIGDTIGFVTAMQVALALASEHDLTAYDLRPERVVQTGARILWLLTKAIMPGERGATIAETLARAWSVDDARLIDAVLIVCADHELNASSFTARVVASTGATPYQVVAGGLAALQGTKHGGHTRRVSAFLREAAAHGDPRVVVAARLQRGEEVYGFGHRLYPDGDPRATYLLQRLKERKSSSPMASTMALAAEIERAVMDVLGEAPTIDFALAVMERALSLPSDAALALFALGRSAGLIAHAMEQYARGQLIRPRAKYVGVAAGD